MNNILVAIGVICLVDHPLLLLKFYVIIISSLLNKKKKYHYFYFFVLGSIKEKTAKNKKIVKMF